MAWYLKFPASTGNAFTNNKLIQLSGIATAGSVNVAVKFAENVIPASVAAYLFDGRRSLDNNNSSGPLSYIARISGVETSGTSNYRLDGNPSSVAAWVSALADQIFSFDIPATGDGVVAVGARFNQTEHYPLMAIKAITITDSRGAHTIDMSASNGTSNEFTSTDGLVSLRLFGFTDNAHWVFYSTGGTAYTLNADGGTFSYSGGAASLLMARRLSANGSNFNYSGGTASLRLARRLQADGGAFNHSGADASLRCGRLLNAGGGAFAFSGGAAGLLYGRTLQADGGSFGYSGGAASFDYTPATGYVMVAEGASFSYSGAPAEFEYVQNFPIANVNNYTVSGMVNSDFSFGSRISPAVSFGAIISTTFTFHGSLN